MNFPVAPNRPPLSRAAMETAPAAKSEPLVRVEWRRVLFFQFEVDHVTADLQPQQELSPGAGAMPDGVRNDLAHQENQILAVASGR